MPAVLSGVVKVAVAGAISALLLAGCADASGQIDDEGHNGYDMMTCEGAKALALDMAYQAVTPATARTRIEALSAAADKASDTEVKKAAQSLIAGFNSGDDQAVRNATQALVTSCQL